MATYKKQCIYCNNLIPEDSNFCPYCRREDPFVFRCLNCKKELQKGFRACPECGFELVLTCSACGKEVSASLKCSECGCNLLKICSKKSCATIQPASNIKCCKCGSSLK